MGAGLSSWNDVACDEAVKLQASEVAAFVTHMETHYTTHLAAAPSQHPLPPITAAALKRLLREALCLFNQIDKPATPSAIVHFCELSLGSKIDSRNAWEAFLFQHPKQGSDFVHGLNGRSGGGGTVMELLCSEILTNAGIPRMPLDADGWPKWAIPGHALLNEGKLGRWKALGDILVPCAPTNLVISVKTQSARERLLYSSNSIEGIGFGFFNQPNEFWTVSRMTLFKRMGFTAIYLPDHTHAEILKKLRSDKTEVHNTNVSGSALYRSIQDFGGDILNVVGKSSDLL